MQTGLGRLSALGHHLVKFVVVIKASRSISSRCVIHADRVDFVQGSSGRPPTTQGLGAPHVLRLEGGTPEHVDIFYCEIFIVVQL